MFEQPPQADPGNAAVHAAQVLTPEAIEAVLADFRSWLTQAAQAPDAIAQPVQAEPPDLYTLLAQLTALRHEVNLQTRAVRSQQEQSAQTVERLGQAMDALGRQRQELEQTRRQDQAELLRPLLQTLIDLHDALSRAARETARLQESLGPLLEQIGEGPAPPSPDSLPPAVQKFQAFWLRWIDRGRSARLARQEEERQANIWEAGEQISDMLDSFFTGYDMSLQRLDRAVKKHGLEPIPCVSHPFDPETMEVVEATADSGQPSGTVLEEVRQGYLWNGRVFRFAQVRVAK